MLPARCPRLVRIVAALVAVTALAVGVALSAHKASAGSVQGDCVVESSDALAAGQSPSPEEAYPYQAWLANDSAQADVGELNAVLDKTFGASEAGDDKRLSQGLIGIASDSYAQELVVVVDPSLVDEQELEKLVSSSIPESGVSVRVAPGCHSAAELQADQAVIEEGQWYSAESPPTYAYYLDDTTSTWSVTFSAKDVAAAESLQARLGDEVKVEFGELGRMSRLEDGEPHWGASGIAHPETSPQNYQCTSGFTADLPTGETGSVTAGHCFIGDSDANLFSGHELYGEVGERATPYPHYDMRKIKPHGENFNRRIHTDPPLGDSRHVTTASDPGDEEFVCLSGATTEAICGVEIVNRDATFCDPAGCTPNLVKARRSGDTVVRAGDSGGPAYNRLDGDEAAIRGMIIAGVDSGDAVLFHKVSTIRNQLGVSGIGG